MTSVHPQPAKAASSGQTSSVAAQAVANNLPEVTARERAVLLVSVLIIAICALTYELIVGTLSSYLLGNSVTQFSLTIGLFLSSMGVGALLSRRITSGEVRWFIIIEVLIGAFGGFSAAILYAVFAMTDIYYYTVMVSLILIIGACIGLEIPLLTRIVATREQLSNALADVLSFDYLGSLVAALAFPLVLLPVLGVTQTAFLMGLFNLLVAGVILHTFRHRLRPRTVRTLGVATVGFVLAMLAGLIFSTSIFDFFEQQLYTDRIIYRQQTPYQRIVLTRDGDDVRLFLDGNLQFSSLDEYRYHEMLVHPAMSAARSHEAVLVLGGGDGFVARELLKYEDVQRIVVVDIDPVITDLARTFRPWRDLNQDALSDPRVELVHQDAYNYIQTTVGQFPVIISDLPDPNTEGLAKLYSEQFYRMLRQRLTPDGVFATQATSPYFVREAFWTIAHTLQAAEFQTLPLHAYVPSFGEWGFIIASPHTTPTVNVPQGLSLRYLTADVLEAAHIFDPDIDQVPTAISTLDDPAVTAAYRDGWNRWD